MKTLYLIDGANYIYRAYYAIRGLSTSKGFPTNALYGFTQMLLKLLRDEKPDYVAVAFDRPEPTFRDEIFEDYKANREAPPDDLVQQFPYFIPLVGAFGVKVCEIAGYEADDIIGTLSKKYASDDLRVVIVSGDKDLMQLVGDNVTILDTMKEARYGVKEVEARFGVPPARVVEVLGLAGDASDNVPGLPGVGPKTASTLIAKYGSIENLIDHADELKPSIREKLLSNREQAMLSRRLVTIDLDVPLEIEIEDLKKGEPKHDELHALFHKFEFTRLLSELAPKKSVGCGDYLLVDDDKMLREVCSKIGASKNVAVFVAASEQPVMSARIIGVALAWGAGEAVYVPIGHTLSLGERELSEKQALGALAPIFSDPLIRKTAHDAKSVKEILERHGTPLNGLMCDTMIAAYLVDASSDNSLEALSSRYLDHQMPARDEYLGKGARRKMFQDLDLKTACRIASESADVCFQLCEKLTSLLDKDGLENLFEEMELPLIDVLAAMETAGIKVDAKRLNDLSRDFAGRLKAIEAEIFDEAGREFNIMSPRQLGDVLFEKLKLPGGKRTKTGYSTGQEILEELAVHHRVPELVISYRQLNKLKSTYIDAIPSLIDPETGRVHTTFNQAVTATGRLSSSDPNLQNIPVRSLEGRMIREAFVPENGCLFLDADYSQIELRVLAHMSNDEALLDAFRNGIDVHAVTASGIFGVEPDKVTEEQRAVGKTVNFATIYGQTPYGLSRQLKIDVSEAARYIDGYFKKYPGVEKYRDHVVDKARENGYVETLFGRRRYLPDIVSSNEMLKSLAERMAFNTVFQGTAADIIKRAMLVIYRELPAVSIGSKMLLQVHDELLFEVPKQDIEVVREFVVKKMESAAELKIPMIVDAGVGRSWANLS